VSGIDSSLVIWNRADLSRAEKVLVGSTDIVTCVAFHPSEPKILGGSRDGAVRMWNLSSAHSDPIELEVHRGGVNDASFSRDGLFAVSLGVDRNVTRFPASTKALAEMAKDKIRRNLTQEEWKRYVGPEFDYEQTIDTLPIGQEVRNFP
jgi:WD40 repeat protein